MINKLKLRITAISVAVIIVAILSQITLSYYSTAYRTSNIVTSGDIQLVIHEITDIGEPFPKEGVSVLPGDIISKRVSVENYCEHPFYLRMKIVADGENQELAVSDWYKLDIDEKNWELYNGWYYYKGIVNPKETTPTLFDTVEVLGNTINKSHIGETLTLTVKANAVQSENNPISGNKTYTALGWPME